MLHTLENHALVYHLVEHEEIDYKVKLKAKNWRKILTKIWLLLSRYTLVHHLVNNTIILENNTTRKTQIKRNFFTKICFVFFFLNDLQKNIKLFWLKSTQKWTLNLNIQQQKFGFSLVIKSYMIQNWKKIHKQNHSCSSNVCHLQHHRRICSSSLYLEQSEWEIFPLFLLLFNPLFFLCNCDMKENGTNKLQVTHLTITTKRRKRKYNNKLIRTALKRISENEKLESLRHY